MVKWLGYEEPAWRSNMRSLAGHLPGRLLPDLLIINKQQERADWAAEMFPSLGPEATNCIPQLVRILNDTNSVESSARAAVALERLGGNGLPPILAALSDPGHSNRVEIIQALDGLERTNGGPAVPVLAGCLRDQDARLVSVATAILAHLKLEPQLVVPELMKGLTNASFRVQLDSLEALGEFGDAARLAVPRLLKLLDDPDQLIREGAEGALEKIAPEELKRDKEAKTHAPPTVIHRINQGP